MSKRKKCSMCGSRRRKVGRSGRCAPCNTAYSIVYKRLYPRSWTVAELLVMLYSDEPCHDCKKTQDHWCQLGFDHLWVEEKSIKIGEYGGWSATKANVEKLFKELEGCQIVCHNCHALRTRALHRENLAYALNKARDYLESIGRLDIWETPPKRWSSSSATKRAKTAAVAMPAQRTATVIPFASLVKRTPQESTSKTATTPTLKTASTSPSTSED